MKKNLLLILVIYVLQLLATSAVFAQPWAEAMFQERRHNFNRVALGSEAVYRFQFKNPYSDDIHIASVRSSCACTTPDWPKTAIKFGETAEIVAKLNTGGQFTGDRKATLTVVIDRPSPAQVQLQVTGYIRPDVVISPGMAEFGAISEGTSAQKVLTLQYAGRTNWKLTHVECSNPHINVKADHVERNDGRIEYKIFVTIEDTMPSGYVHDMVRFTTNDTNPNASVVMFPVHGFVTAPLVAKPSPLVVGFIQPGETIKKNIVLHSDVPFRITKVTSKDRRFQFAISDDKNNSIHVLPIAFTADSSLGSLSEPIIIHTTLAGQKQMQLLTQGMVYDTSFFDETRSRVKHQLAGQPQEQSSGQLSEKVEFTDLPPTIQGNQKKAGLPQGAAQMHIRMTPNNNAVQDVSLQKTTNTIAFNMNSVEKQSKETAVGIADVVDNPHETGGMAVVLQEETHGTVPDLKVVPRLMPGELGMSLEVPDMTTQPQVVVKQEPEDLFVPQPTPAPIPITTGKQQPINDFNAVPFEAVNEQAVERTNDGILTPETAVPSQNSDEKTFTGFQVMEDTPVQQHPVLPKVNVQTDNRPVDNSPVVDVDHPTVEQKTFIDSSPNSPLTFTTPSIKTNLEEFTGTKPQPVINHSDAFAIVDDSQKVTGTRKSTKIISETLPPKIPPVPEMIPIQVPVTPPFTSTHAASENESIKQSDVSPKISNRLSPPPLPATMNSSPGVLDSNRIAEMFGGTGISDTSSDATNHNVAQMPPQDNMRTENPDEQGGLKPMELQPLQQVNPGTWNAQLMTTAPILHDEMEYEGWGEEDTIPGQPGVILPLLERKPRLNVTNIPRGKITLDDDLPMNMPNPLMVSEQGRLGPADVVSGAPIPTMPPSRQPGSNRMLPNNMPNMSAQQISQLPTNTPQHPANMPPQHPGVQQPQPGNSQQTAQMQTAQPRLTPQQVQPMQQMQRMQQMQEMQRIQMRQRQAAAGQQPSRTAAPTPLQQNRVAQTNPRPSPQQPLVVPPAPTVPNTPMMTPAPVFRR